MKRVQLLLFALVATVAAWAAQPDFAFPQTVDKDARKDLSAAVKSHDAHAALNALMRIYAANAIIREQGYAQQSIELAEQTATKFAGSPLAGILTR